MGRTPREIRTRWASGVLLADAACVIAGLPVAKEVFGRLGARFRPLAEEGTEVTVGDAVAELGGPLAAMRGAAPTAIRLLVASVRGRVGPARTRVGRRARRVRGAVVARGAVGHDGPSFHLEMRD